MSRISPETAWATDLEKADMCERLSFPPEDSRHITVDNLLREYAAILRAGHAQTPMETCERCMGSGYSNHPDSGEVCEACKGQGAVSQSSQHQTEGE